MLPSYVTEAHLGPKMGGRAPNPRWMDIPLQPAPVADQAAPPMPQDQLHQPTPIRPSNANDGYNQNRPNPRLPEFMTEEDPPQELERQRLEHSPSPLWATVAPSSSPTQIGHGAVDSALIPATTPLQASDATPTLSDTLSSPIASSSAQQAAFSAANIDNGQVADSIGTKEDPAELIERAPTPIRVDRAPEFTAHRFSPPNLPVITPPAAHGDNGHVADSRRANERPEYLTESAPKRLEVREPSPPASVASIEPTSPPRSANDSLPSLSQSQARDLAQAPLKADPHEQHVVNEAVPVDTLISSSSSSLSPFPGDQEQELLARSQLLLSVSAAPSHDERVEGQTAPSNAFPAWHHQLSLAASSSGQQAAVSAADIDNGQVVDSQSAKQDPAELTVRAPTPIRVDREPVGSAHRLSPPSLPAIAPSVTDIDNGQVADSLSAKEDPIGLAESVPKRLKESEPSSSTSVPPIEPAAQPRPAKGAQLSLSQPQSRDLVQVALEAGPYEQPMMQALAAEKPTSSSSSSLSPSSGDQEQELLARYQLLLSFIAAPSQEERVESEAAPSNAPPSRTSSAPPSRASSAPPSRASNAPPSRASNASPSRAQLQPASSPSADQALPHVARPAASNAVQGSLDEARQDARAAPLQSLVVVLVDARPSTPMSLQYLQYGSWFVLVLVLIMLILLWIGRELAVASYDRMPTYYYPS